MSAKRWVVLLALVTMMAVAGGASAATLVGSAQVKDGSLLGRDLATGAVRSVDVKNDSLTAADFVVPPLGPAGETGDQGRTGQPGRHGLFAHRVFRTAPGSKISVHAVSCGPTKALYGGMLALGSSATSVDLVQSAPQGGGSDWVFAVRNKSVGDVTVEFYVTCATAR